ncbi:hypothetical protein MPNT_160011 [Candidatus Methylacidithermus pantelleriae]|uniref:Uncharacterized protein n=1 Tax=Candidatus Methylacidithermus pantelleriae TaxID=2744239 RepID=A0A8J2BRK4_9BACT|nr:hypothetical protein MPNT_160011 [Candidatus Methylacidithermus pantelleriae]
MFGNVKELSNAIEQRLSRVCPYVLPPVPFPALRFHYPLDPTEPADLPHSTLEQGCGQDSEHRSLSGLSLLSPATSPRAAKPAREILRSWSFSHAFCSFPHFRPHRPLDPSSSDLSPSSTVQWTSPAPTWAAPTPQEATVGPFGSNPTSRPGGPLSLTHMPTPETSGRLSATYLWISYSGKRGLSLFSPTLGTRITGFEVLVERSLSLGLFADPPAFRAFAEGLNPHLPPPVLPPEAIVTRWEPLPPHWKIHSFDGAQQMAGAPAFLFLFPLPLPLQAASSTRPRELVGF